MNKKEWWREAVVYQIYPKSFQDSNQDGIGDIRGIINRLDYIKELGVNVVWICPVYRSPMHDNGYDIADYYQIDPMFGTDKDLDDLIQEADKKGIKILMDLVVNHTSNQHEWFQKALEDPEGKYGAYYVFRKGKNGQPPDNLRSYFGGSVWEPIGINDYYYFHSFAKEQPDLNWENEELRKEICLMVNFWLEKGIAGFRIDAIGNIKKNLERDYYEPDGADGLCHAGTWILNQPGIETFLKELDDKTFRVHNSMTVAEVGVPEERLNEFIGEDGFFRMVFEFSYADIDVPESGEWYLPTGWTVKEFRKKIFDSQLLTQKTGWGCVYLENHDQPRSINKYIKEEDINYYSKTMLAGLFLCLRGTPFIYQGQEIGMTNIHMDSLEDYNDIATIDQYHRAIKNGVSEKGAWDFIYKRSRDNSRTPMQWDHTKYAGFTEGNYTWIKVNDNYTEINVEEERKQEHSVFHFYQKLIEMRRNSTYQELLVDGKFCAYEEENDSENVIGYERSCGNRTLLILCNMGKETQFISLKKSIKEVVLCNYQEVEPTQKLSLRSYECLILEIEEQDKV